MIVWRSDDYVSIGRALLLDRDGVINEKIDGGYVLSRAGLRIIPEFTNCVRPFVEMGIPLIVVSNQACIGRGLVEPRGVEDVMTELRAVLSRDGVRFAGYAICPHAPEDRCSCRKPAPGLLHEAERLFDIALDRSVFIGDSQSDVDAGRAAGCPTHLVDPADTQAYRTAFQRALLAMSEAVTS